MMHYFSELIICLIMPKLDPRYSFYFLWDIFIAPWPGVKVQREIFICSQCFIFFGYETANKTEVPCHRRHGTIKIPGCSKAMSAQLMPKFCNPLPAFMASPCEGDVRSWRLNNIFFCLFWGFFVSLENFSFIWRRHHCWWRAANFDLCSALVVIEQWGFFSVPCLLWHGASIYNGRLGWPVTLTRIAKGLAVELSLPNFKTVAVQIRTPNLLLAGPML